MYGYFKPGSSRLTAEETRIFKSYYCRTCFCLRILGGQSARLFTTYDMAVYSLLLHIAGKLERMPYHRCERFGTRTMHTYDHDEMGRKLANLSIIMFGEKIRDDEMDGDRAAAAGMNLIYRKTVEKARRAEPEAALAARHGIDHLNEMQNQSAELFDVLQAYGDTVAHLFDLLFGLDETIRRAIRSIAVWTFYMDMLSDYNDDYRKKAYNGFRVEGEGTILKRFDTDYPAFIRINKQIVNDIRLSLYETEDGSDEWRILNKLIDQALSTSAQIALSTRKEKAEMYSRFFRERPCCGFCGKRTNERM